MCRIDLGAVENAVFERCDVEAQRNGATGGDRRATQHERDAQDAHAT
jgi:hypothetical protein